MILALKNGKLIPPATAAAGRKRAFILAAECRRIDEQLHDSKRRNEWDVFAAKGLTYEHWRLRATQALTLHNLELRLLSEWLEQQGLAMLKKSSALFNKLISEDDIEFYEDERKFIGELTEFVKGE